MSEESSNLSRGNLDVRLRALWARQTGRVVLRGACWLLAALGAMVLVDLLLDWPLDLPGAARMVLLAANVGALLGIAYGTLVRRLRRYDALEEALEVERALPDLNGLAVSSVQFGDERGYGQAVSRELMRAVRRQADERTAGVDLAKATPSAAIVGALAGAVMAAAAVCGTAAWKGEHLRVLAQRMFNPASTAGYPTATRIDVLSGEPVIRHGESVALRARAAGVVPAGGRVWVRYKGMDWEAIDVVGVGAEFEHVLAGVTEDVEYSFGIGDAKSPRRRVTVVRPPRIVEGRIELQYPAYTRLKAHAVETFNLKVPEGTTLSWRLKLDRAVLGAEMKLEGAEGGKALAISAGGREARLELPAEASRPYSISLRWRLGEREYVEAGPRHYIQVIPDADPQVGLLRPAEDTKATLKKTVSLSYWARDDYGLGEANIVYSVNDGAEKRQALAGLAGATSAEKEFAWPITQVITDLKANDIVTFAVEVADGRPGKPGRSRSISRRVQFVTDGDYVAYVLARQRKFLGQLRPLYVQEKEAARALEATASGPTTRREAAP